MTRAVCTHCGLALDPDAPGAGCSVCLGETPSPRPRRPSARAPLSTFGRVAAIACALSGEGALTGEHMAEARAIDGSKVEA